MALSASAAQATEPPVVDICEIAAWPENYLEQTVTVEARVEGTQHGFYANGRNCADVYVWTYLDDIEDSNMLGRFLAIAPRAPEEPEFSLLKVRVTMRDYRLWGTNSVFPRLFLGVVEVNPSEYS